MESGTQRQDWMRILAHAQWTELSPLFASVGMPAAATWLRPPETGMVMVRARAGGSGIAFNAGEATVTRCAVQLQDGIVGHSYILGRNADHARAAAVIDAWMQVPERAGEMRQRILQPLQAIIDARRDLASRKAAATRVDFFTLVRGED